MNNTMAIKKPFPVAAIFFVIQGTLNIGGYMFRIFFDRIFAHFDFNYVEIINEVSYLLYIFIPLALGIILLIVKKNNISLPILFGFFFLDILYWLIYDIPYFLSFNNIYHFLECIFYVFNIVAFSLIILFSILSLVYRTKKCGFLTVWFIPGILYTISSVILLYFRFKIGIFSYGDYAFIIYECCNIAIKLIVFSPALFLLGYWLYKENKYKAVLSTTPMTIPSYSENSTVPAFDPDINTVSQSVEQTPSYRDQYNTPNRQNYTQVPSYNYQGNFQMQQPAYNTQNTFPTQQPAYTQHTPQEQLHVTDELLKYKHLLDVGAITAEDYEIKKKQLLGL